MSVIIKGLEMPKSCAICSFTEFGRNSNCLLFDEWVEAQSDGRPKECPIIELPEKHGRLIDADELLKQFRYGENDTDIDKAWTATIRRAIKQAPTVIESEGKMNGDIKAQEAKELLKQYCDINICEDCIFCNIG